VRGLGETVEKQMVENHHLLRNGERHMLSPRSSISKPRISL
jgi:hypothetical protein